MDERSMKTAGDQSRVRLATIDDIPAILDIANYYALNTYANFAIEPESLDAWRDAFQRDSALHPWYVAVDEIDTRKAFRRSRGSPSPRRGRADARTSMRRRSPSTSTTNITAEATAGRCTPRCSKR
jgi:hypothetical protein